MSEWTEYQSYIVPGVIGVVITVAGTILRWTWCRKWGPYVVEFGLCVLCAAVIGWWKGLFIAGVTFVIYIAMRLNLWFSLDNRRRILQLERDIREKGIVKSFSIVSDESNEVLSGADWRRAELVKPVHPRWITDLPGTQWIAHRRQVTTEEAQQGCTYRVKKVFEIVADADPSSLMGTLYFRVDNVATCTINDKTVKHGKGHRNLQKAVLSDCLKTGENTIEFQVHNNAQGARGTVEGNPTGLLYRVEFQYRLRGTP